MKLKLYTNSCVLVEHSGIRVLCDPWFTQGAYYGSWFQMPYKLDPDEFDGIDYLYISHVHPDHFDPKFLSTMDKNITVLICEYEEKYLKRQIEQLGFTRVVELPTQTKMNLGADFNIEMFAADDVNATLFEKIYRCTPKNYRRTLQIDSLAVFSGGGRVLVNTNDVPAGLAQVPLQYIARKYPHIDCALVSYAGAGPFPQAYDYDAETKGGFAFNCQAGYLANTTTQILSRLNADVFIPFAGGYILGGEYVGMNKYKGTAELDQLPEDLIPLLRKAGVQSEMLMLDAGGTYDIGRGGYTGGFKGTDFQAREKFTQSIAGEKFTFSHDPIPDDPTGTLKDAYAVLTKKMKQYDYQSNWSVFIDTDGKIFQVPFDGSGIGRVEACDANKPYLYAKIDPRLLNRILNREANWNNAEVGSHLLMRQFNPIQGRPNYEPMVHFLMAYFQMPR